MKWPTFIAACAALALFGTAAIPASAAGETCAKVRRVAEWDFLYIRSRPDHRSASVGAIDPSTDNRILLNGECLPKGAPDRDAWCPISYFVAENAAITGYVKKYYIALGKCD